MDVWHVFEAAPLIPMQLVMAAAQMRARERLQLRELPVIMQLQEQPRPQLASTIHNVACAPSRPSPSVIIITIIY